MMADVLKNNLLEGPALSLVRSITDIDEIWERLKRSYDDPKKKLLAPKEKTTSFGSNKSNQETERFRENSVSSEQNDQYYEGSGAFGT